MTIEVFLASIAAIGVAAILIYAMTRQPRSQIQQRSRRDSPDRERRGSGHTSEHQS